MSVDQTASILKEKRRKYKSDPDISKLIYSLRPILVMGQVFGIFRFCIKNKKLLPNGRKTKCIAVCIVTVYIGARVAYFSQTIATSYLQTTTLVEKTDILSSALVVIDCVAMFVTHSLTQSTVNVQIISFIASLDSRLHINIRENVYKKLRNYVSCVLCYLTISNVVFCVLYSIICATTFISAFFTDFLYLQQDNETAFLCIIILLLKYRLSVINDNLKKLIGDGESMQTVFVNTIGQEMETRRRLKPFGSCFAAKLHELALAYDTVGETCSLVNSLFNFHLFMVLASTFTYILNTLWLLLYSFHTSNVVKGIVTTLCWCTYKFLYVIALSLSCESLKWKRDETRALVNELVMQYALPARTRAQAKALAALVDAWPLRVLVYDMFAVDMSLLLKFISVSTTYFIVLIQICHFV